MCTKKSKKGGKGMEKLFFTSEELAEMAIVDALPFSRLSDGISHRRY